MYDKISDARDSNQFSIGVFFDLSKAFDTVNHKILLKKLDHYGIRGMCLTWLRDYLTGRKQYVFYNGTASCMLDVNCGVPQGSILGPLLFLMYVNDTYLASSVLQFIMFADDTNVFMSNNSLIELVSKLNVELVKVDRWFKANKLSLNLKKN
jgi:retron-type reverse transcriptase